MASAASAKCLLQSQPFVAGRGSSRPRVVTCSAAAEPQQTARRSLLARGLALLAASAAPAQASVGRWDGVSSAIGSCELGEAGTECRQQILARDRENLNSYDSTVSGDKGDIRPGNKVSVAAMGDKYSQDTLALTDKVLAFAELNSDPGNPQRLQLIKELKAEFPTWVSRYARGGSARTVSARKVYVVIDAISGHFASNGLAPLPRSKLQKLVDDVQAGRALLAEGK